MMLAALFMTACAKSGPEVKTEDKDGEVVVGEDGTMIAELNCDEGMKEYAVEGTPVEFCYDETWGEVKVADNEGATSGKSLLVSFSEKEGIRMQFDSLDLGFTDVDFAPSDFSLINPSLSEEEIEAQVKEFYNQDRGLTEEYKVLDVRKSDVAGVRAVRVELENADDGKKMIEYIVPNAFENFHMWVSAPAEMAEDLDNFAYAMVINQ